MIFGLCHFLFHQFTQRDEPYQIIADMDALTAFSAAFIRCPDIDRLNQLMGRICYTKNTLPFSNVIRVKAERKEGAMIAELYTVYRTELLRYCCMICGNVSDAEDLLQETFMKALSNLDLLEELGEKERRAWLYKVARNLFYDACRRRTVEQNNQIQAEEETDGGFSEVEVAMILSSLPPDLSQFFIKRYFDGYTSKELAVEYGLSPSGVRAALSRARKLLREKLK